MKIQFFFTFAFLSINSYGTTKQQYNNVSFELMDQIQKLIESSNGSLEEGETLERINSLRENKNNLGFQFILFKTKRAGG